MDINLVIVGLVLLLVNREAETDHKQKLQLELIHFFARYTADACEEGVVEVVVVEELSRQHHASDKQTVDIQRVDHEVGVGLNPVHVDEGQDETGVGTLGVLVQSVPRNTI